MPAVVATAETAPAPLGGGEADDPAIWIHPTDVSQSLILGTVKGAGLGAYNLDGSEQQFVPGADLNNVDLRYNFPLGEEEITLVLATNRTNPPGTIAAYRIDEETRQLSVIDLALIVPPGLSDEIYGTCMYVSPTTGRHYVFLTSKAGEIQQWELDGAGGNLSAKKLRDLSVPTQPEACVVDDELEKLYVGEESAGIWKFGANPLDPVVGQIVAPVKPAGHIAIDLEGLALYYAQDGKGYLLASGQGEDEFVVFERGGDNAYVTTFEVGASSTIDEVTHSDGIEVLGFGLGPSFPNGVFVAQDNFNPGAKQNFKLVAWDDIAQSPDRKLTVDTTWDPRSIGK